MDTIWAQRVHEVFTCYQFWGVIFLILVAFYHLLYAIFLLIVNSGAE